MARIEDLIDEIANPSLREEIARQVKMLKTTKRFGLVFEDHVPETVSLPGLTMRPGLVVQHRRKPEEATRYQVLSVDNGKATIVPVGLDEPVETVAAEDLLVVKAFEEPIFPGLTLVGEVQHGPDGKPAHSVINGENFHALQLLAYTHVGKVDVIYIDPPYNTGARDWKYNNRFVDNNDAWRHSRWLAMMEKRLKLSRKLLTSNGVLIVTIDEHEVHHLGMLLEEIFPDATLQMIDTLINPAAVARQEAFGRSDEYIFFVFLGSAAPQRVRLSREWVSARGRTHTGKVRWDLLRRSGEGAARSDSPGCFYPIYVDPSGPKVALVGEALPSGQSTPEELDGCVAVLPIRQDGSEGRWQWTPSTFRSRLEQGRVRISGSRDKGFVVSILKDGEYRKIQRGEFEVIGTGPNGSLQVKENPTDTVLAVPGTQWRISSHDSTQYGSRLLRAFLPDRKFPFPKSLYAVADTIRFFVSDKPDALILDFFAGSATTLHGVALLNRQDGGNRQCILVTNNDVSEADSRRLNKSGYFVGDPEFEVEGIFESVTKPRVEAAITGLTPQGNAVAGKYLDQYLPAHSYADGFEENVAFFRMDYLEPDLVELGRQYNAIVPMLWMAAGAVGSWEDWDGRQPWSAPIGSTYAVLFDLSEAAAFAEMVESRPEITHAWVVTDSHGAFVEVRAELPAGVEVGQLYRQYLRNFTVNAPGVLE